MPVKRYGVYLDYGPTRELRAEGLGRQLASFLKGAAERSDVEFVLACPSWGREQLEQLCAAENASLERFEILSPEALPLSLRAYRAYQLRTARKAKVNRFWFSLRRVRIAFDRARKRIERRLVSSRSVVAIGMLFFALVPVGIAAVILSSALASRRWISRNSTAAIVKMRPRLVRALLVSGGEPFLRRLYRHLEETETDLLISMINRRTDIAAWYCPTAFWPQFTRIRAPRLMCVPDVVAGDFPVGFELVGGRHFFESFRRLQQAIRGSRHYVTYSQHIKWQTLVNRYAIAPALVHVVPHASQELAQSIDVSGTADNERATDVSCGRLYSLALRSAANSAYTASFRNERVEFIFYASQFRPNKNVITLLRAYEHLLRDRYRGVKLILTGRSSYGDVADFVRTRRLSHDVLFLSNLPMQQLAACYRLARLAINPSLFEGGFPFTFTEALSVGTPVVMARIPVTEEVITDPDLQSLMLFDPYDWKDMANRIEWALENRAALLSKQQPLYDRLAQRTWRHVVDDHVEILDRIAAQECRAAEKT